MDKKVEHIYRDEIRREITDPDFANDYVRIKHFSSIEEAIPYFCDLEV